MNVSASAAEPNSSVAEENVTDFMLAPGGNGSLREKIYDKSRPSFS